MIYSQGFGGGSLKGWEGKLKEENVNKFSYWIACIPNWKNLCPRCVIIFVATAARGWGWGCLWGICSFFFSSLRLIWDVMEGHVSPTSVLQPNLVMFWSLKQTHSPAPTQTQGHVKCLDAKFGSVQIEVTVKETVNAMIKKKKNSLLERVSCRPSFLWNSYPF